jgi:23S rRNA pseudouridine2457 synthase
LLKRQETMAGLILINKPFQVLSQFTDREGRRTLADFLDAPGFRVAGRLDYDSEGLLILTDDGVLQQRIANPASGTWKTYWVQVEGKPSPEALSALRAGIALKDGRTRPARAALMEAPPGLWPRRPPIRQRREDITTWMELKIREGRNRQVRRMTAAVGFPTLRLIRATVGNWTLDGLAVGEYRTEEVHMPLQHRRPRR